MTDLDRQARELLAAECPECGGDGGFEFGEGDWRNCGRCADVHTVPRSQAVRAIRAALTTAPDGFALVRVEPTRAMLKAASNCGPYPSLTDRWKAMLAAAKEAGN